MGLYSPNSYTRRYTVYTYCSTGNKDYQQASGHPHSIPLCARMSLPPKHSRADRLWALAPKYDLISYHHSCTHYTNPFPLPHFVDAHASAEYTTRDTFTF